MKDFGEGFFYFRGESTNDIVSGYGGSDFVADFL